MNREYLHLKTVILSMLGHVVIHLFFAEIVHILYL